MLKDADIGGGSDNSGDQNETIKRSLLASNLNEKTGYLNFNTRILFT